MEVRSLTIRGNGRLNTLRSDVTVATPHVDPTQAPVRQMYSGIWDTGATNSVVTPKVVASLGLQPTGMVKVNAAGISEIRSKYVVDIVLPNGVGFQSVEVTEAALTEHDDVLIGMDIITLGDFSITNINQKTDMSFRTPSMKEVDFVKESQGGLPLLNRQQRRQMNRKRTKKNA